MHADAGVLCSVCARAEVILEMRTHNDLTKRDDSLTQLLKLSGMREAKAGIRILLQRK